MVKGEEGRLRGAPGAGGVCFYRLYMGRNAHAFRYGLGVVRRPSNEE